MLRKNIRDRFRIWYIIRNEKVCPENIDTRSGDKWKKYVQDRHYSIVYVNNEEHYTIIHDTKTIVIEDHFFRHHKESLSYLKKENFPSELIFFHALDMEIPIVYGVDKFIQHDGNVRVGLDIFASIFFMLTRWEESLMGREENGDCNEDNIWAIKNGVFKRPIVHEYESLLRMILFGSDAISNRKYKVILTHDVDGIETPSYRKIIKTGLNHKIYGRPKLYVINLTWKEMLDYKRLFSKTTSQFECYSKLCAKHNIEEWFYFKVCKEGEEESTYSYNGKQMKEAINYLNGLNQTKICVGFHPSQSTFMNNKQWNDEVSRIKKVLGGIPQIGRNHHLLYNYDMLQKWDEFLGQQTQEQPNISNCVFHKHLGFRSGVAVPYPIFDIFNRKVMRIVEYSCPLMDTAIRYTKYSSDEECWNDITSIIDLIRKYRGVAIFTWHIYIRNVKLIEKYLSKCDKTIQYATR